MVQMRRIVVLLIAAGCVLWVHAYAAESKPAAAPAKAAKKNRKAKAKAQAPDANSPQTMPAKAPKPTPYGFREVNDGSLAGCLELLGQFKKPPEVMFRLYEAAYKALAAKADATFMDVANDHEVQRICKENGIGHLGGPLLGSVRPDGAAVWISTLRPAKVEVRVTVGGADKTSGSLLGSEQMKWLKAQLLDCKGPFIIMSCGTMWSDYISNGKDSWGVYDPQGREELFSFIEANRIGGVLLISGDRHGARGFTIPRPSGFKFHEFEPGSLGGRSGPEVFAKDRENQLFGIARKYAFGEFTIDATVADPTVEFRLIGDDGTMIHEMKLTRSQLTPAGKVGR